MCVCLTFFVCGWVLWACHLHALYHAQQFLRSEDIPAHCVSLVRFCSPHLLPSGGAWPPQSPEQLTWSESPPPKGGREGGREGGDESEGGDDRKGRGECLIEAGHCNVYNGMYTHWVGGNTIGM